jgi:hypothetical protein
MPELHLAIVWPPELAAAARDRVRTIAWAIGQQAEAAFLVAGVAPPAVELLLLPETPGAPRHRAGRYLRTAASHGRIEVVLPADLVRDADAVLTTIAHELGHLVVDFLRGWEGGATPLAALGASVLDEYLAERIGWALLAGVPVANGPAAARLLRLARIHGAQATLRRGGAGRDAPGPADGRNLVSALYHLAYARGARDAGALVWIPLPALLPAWAAIDTALRQAGRWLGPSIDATALRRAPLAAVQAAVMALGVGAALG